MLQRTCAADCLVAAGCGLRLRRGGGSYLGSFLVDRIAILPSLPGVGGIAPNVRFAIGVAAVVVLAQALEIFI